MITRLEILRKSEDEWVAMSIDDTVSFSADEIDAWAADSQTATMIRSLKIGEAIELGVKVKAESA